jgi:hypothetical protein
MPARDEQQQIREGKIGIGQARAERMALEMVDRDERLACGVCQRLAGDEPDHHATDQPRAGGGGDRIDVAQSDAGVGERAFDQRHQRLDMRARGDFGHHAAERTMRGFLAGKAVRQDAAVAGDERRCRFIAGGF